MWRLILASVFFLLSLLTLFRAPTNLLWKTAVAVTEFPYIPITLSLVLFMLCLRAESYKLPLLLLSGCSVLLYSSTIFRAYARARKLPAELGAVFSTQRTAGQLEQPFSFLQMFKSPVKDRQPEIYTYKQLQDTSLSLDFYAGPDQKNAPCILVVHGGSWQSGDSKQLPKLNSYLASQGYAVAAINYRLAPRYKSPAPVEDLKDAIRYLVQESERLHIDTTNFILLGRSAGAQIALVAAYSFNDPRIRGVISLYGPADMVWAGRNKGNKWVLNTDKVFDDYLGGSIDQVPEKFAEASACVQLKPKAPPSLLIHGEIDAMVAFEHSRRLDKKLFDCGVPHYFLDLPWATHGCDYNFNGPGGQITTYAIERFIHSVTTH